MDLLDLFWSILTDLNQKLTLLNGSKRYNLTESSTTKILPISISDFPPFYGPNLTLFWVKKRNLPYPRLLQSSSSSRSWLTIMHYSLTAPQGKTERCFDFKIRQKQLLELLLLHAHWNSSLSRFFCTTCWQFNMAHLKL